MSKKNQRGSAIARFMARMAGPVMASARWPDSTGQPYGYENYGPSRPATSRAWRDLQDELSEEEARREAERERVRRQAAARRAARQANGTSPRPERVAQDAASFGGQSVATPTSYQFGSSVHKRSMGERPARRNHRRQVMPARLG